MGAGASSSDITKNEFMLQRQKPVNGTDIRDMGHALDEIAKLRTLCRLIDPQDMNEFLNRLSTGDTPIHDSSPHNYRIISSNISSVPNPILPTNTAPPLMPTVFGEATPALDKTSYKRPTSSGNRPSSGKVSKPTTLLKGCLKSHTRAHSSATAKRLRFSDQLTENTAFARSSADTAQAPAVEADPQVQLDKSGPPFDMSVCNPDYRRVETKSNHTEHYVPLAGVPHRPRSIPEHVKYHLDHRVLSLTEAFQYLDVHNSGYITQEELINACWYWGVHLTPADFQLLRETYPPDLVTTTRGDPRIYYPEFIDLMSRIMAPQTVNPADEEELPATRTIDALLRSRVLDSGQTMRQTFKEFDRDGSGSIDHNELALILKTYHIQYTEIQLDDLFVDFDVNRDSRIQYNEFVKMMQGISVHDRIDGP